MATIQYTPAVSTTGTAETPMSETPVQPSTEPVAQANAVEVRLTSAQLKERLDETRAAAERRLLAELGVDSIDKAKERVKASQPEDEDDESPKKKRLKELESSAAAQAAKIAELESLVAAVTHERASSTLSSLPEQARRAIEDATDDPEERIALAQVLAAAGVSAPIAAAPQTAVPQAVASTAPPRTAPADASSSPPDRKAEYARLKRENPVAAAHYLSRFAKQIFPGS